MSDLYARSWNCYTTCGPAHIIAHLHLFTSAQRHFKRSPKRWGSRVDYFVVTGCTSDGHREHLKLLRSSQPDYPSISLRYYDLPLVADADPAMCSQPALHYHVRPKAKAKRYTGVLNVHKFTYMRKQRCNEFISHEQTFKFFLKC